MDDTYGSLGKRANRVWERLHTTGAAILIGAQLLTASPARADEIKLKDGIPFEGTVFEGEVILNTEDRLVVKTMLETKDGDKIQRVPWTLGLEKKDVESVEKKPYDPNTGKPFTGFQTRTTQPGAPITYKTEKSEAHERAVRILEGQDKARAEKNLSPSSIGSLEAYEDAIKEQGVLIESEHIAYFAPKSGEAYARLVVPILEKAYQELEKWHAGVGTRYRIAVEHYPPGHERAKGGVSNHTLLYGFGNIGLWEDAEKRVPHVVGYIEEMTHTFDRNCGVGAWLYEGLGNYTANAITPKVAPCKQLDDFSRGVSKVDAETFDYYVKHFKLPPDVPQRLFDRIYRHLFRQLEPAAGNELLPRFYQELKKVGQDIPAVMKMLDAQYDEQAAVVAGIFSRITGRDAVAMFKAAHIRVDEKTLRDVDRAYEKHGIVDETRLDDTNFDERIKSSKIPVLVDFLPDAEDPRFGDRSKLIDGLAKKYEGKIKFFRVYADAMPETVRRHNVGAPALVLFIGGKERFIPWVPNYDITTRSLDSSLKDAGK